MKEDRGLWAFDSSALAIGLEREGSVNCLSSSSRMWTTKDVCIMSALTATLCVSLSRFCMFRFREMDSSKMCSAVTFW